MKGKYLTKLGADLFLSHGVMFAILVPKMAIKAKCDIFGCNKRDAG